MGKYETIYLDGYLLPRYGTLTEVTNLNAAEHVALDGSRHVDFFNNRRVWKWSRDLISANEYNLIRSKYDKQYSTGQMLPFVVNDINLFTQAFMTISDKNIRFSGQWVEGLELQFEEYIAIS